MVAVRDLTGPTSDPTFLHPFRRLMPFSAEVPTPFGEFERALQTALSEDGLRQDRLAAEPNLRRLI